MSLFGNLVNPSIALNLIRKQLEKNTGLHIHNYDILYVREPESLIFLIKGDKYTLEDSKTITNLIKGAIKAKMKKGQIVDLIKISTKLVGINGTQQKEIIDCTVYFTENSEKCYNNFVL